MMTSMPVYLRKGQRQVQRWLQDPLIRTGVKILACGGSGFLLSAASLSGLPQPLAMGLICTLTGWRAAVTALGSMLGYAVFWGAAGMQGVLWAVLGMTAALFLGKRKETEEQPLLMCAMAAFLMSTAGLGFQILLQDDTPIQVYLLRITIAGASTWLFQRVTGQRDAITGWVAGGVAVLALARVMPIPYLGLGYGAGALLAVSGAFPAAALAGLGLDLSQVTQVPMAAVLCIAYFFRLAPTRTKWLRAAAPAAACVLVMAVCGIWEFAPLPGLILGGALGILLPAKPELAHRRGETGLAQVRLELTAGVLAQTQQLLLETAPTPIDEEAILQKVRDRACATCSARSVCREQERLHVSMLHHPLDFDCRKTGRVAAELRRGQEQLRNMKADRERQRQYRAAVIQQYRFLADYLQCLADQLPRRGERVIAHFRLEVSARSRAKERANGDCCVAFSGAGCKYYVLLCDGMGTGLGAAQEGHTTVQLLRQMLTAGFPAEYAFRSINSILALRGQAGAVTLDLAEIKLDSGRVILYKWGAAPSWILRKTGAEKIGTATLPPGISVTEGRESVVRLSLRRGEALILLSDGVEVGDILRRKGMAPDAPPGEMAEKLLELSRGKGEDDATAAVIRLHPLGSQTS